MKTKKQIELIPIVVLPRGPTARAAVALLALASAINPVLQNEGEAPAYQSD